MKRFFILLLALAVPPAVYFPTLGARNDARMRAAESEIRDLTIKIEQARAAQRKLPQFHEEKDRLGQELIKLRVILPPAMQTDALRGTVESHAAAGSVRLTRFEPRPARPLFEVQQQSIEAEVVGSAERTSQFFRDLSNDSRIMNVTSVTLRPDPAGWRTDFVLTAYALPD